MESGSTADNSSSSGKTRTRASVYEPQGQLFSKQFFGVHYVVIHRF